MAHHHASEKCSVCGENEALIFVKVLVDESIEEKGLCAACAIRYMENREQFKGLETVDHRILEALEEMRTLLSSIVSSIGSIGSHGVPAALHGRGKTENRQTPDTRCRNCGLTFDQFKESGYFGCADCYQAFRESVRELLLEIERGGRHRGRMPRKFARLYLLRKEIQFLKNQLKKSVHSEDYETADRIKRKLEKLIGSSSLQKDDEIG